MYNTASPKTESEKTT